MKLFYSHAKLRVKSRARRINVLLTALFMLINLIGLSVWNAPNVKAANYNQTAVLSESETPESDVIFTFSDSDITASQEDYQDSISDTTLTIGKAGVYEITGSCSEGNIIISGSVTGVTLIFDNLNLSCSTTAPLLCKKNSDVTIYLSGSSVLTDSEDPETEETNEDFEGAAIRVNGGGNLKITGDGDLTADGSSCKNGVNGGSGATIAIQSGAITIQAAKNGLAADNAVKIQGGVLNITAGQDGIKSNPADITSDGNGEIMISGGDITINAQDEGIQSIGATRVSGGKINITSSGDAINAESDINISNGEFIINSQTDGIQTDSNLNITNGVFQITTLNGYNDTGFDADTMSCKGLKASSSSDDSDNSDTSDDNADSPSNTIAISGGEFVLNTADDAIHSDGYIVITGGKFTIQTGDDGVHADTSLTLGSSQSLDRDPDITILNSYEGLEAGNVYIYGGKYYIISSDDGINAAGGGSDGSDPGGGGGSFNPGGGPGGGPGWGGGRLMGNLTGAPARLAGDFNYNARLAASGDYSLNIAGGKIYVNVDGDGLDSNGALNLTGGEIEVWGMRAGGDNEPLDCDGTLTIYGATVFAAGSTGMGVPRPSGGQTYFFYPTSVSSSSGFGRGGMGGGSTIAAGTLFTVQNGSNIIYQAQNSDKMINYAFYSSPSASSSWTLSASTGTVSCAYGHAWLHDWNDGEITTVATETASGVRTYTCSECGATELETIPMLTSNQDSDSGDDDENNQDNNTAYTVTFQTDEHCTVNLYYTQDYATPNETGVTTAQSRSKTGELDASGDGQVNFEIVPDEDYIILASNITASPEENYNNLKDSDETGVENIYRLTKNTGDVTVTIISMQADSISNTITIDSESNDATVDLNLDAQNITAGNYNLIVGFYSADGQLLKSGATPITLDESSCGSASDLTVPSDFKTCKAFLLDTSNHNPVCEKIALIVL